jgi:hypothetical protein
MVIKSGSHGKFRDLHVRYCSICRMREKKKGEEGLLGVPLLLGYPLINDLDA